MLSFNFGVRRWARFVPAALGAAALAAALAPAGEAAFTDTSPCSGSAINAEGSSLQNVAQNQLWIPQSFPNDLCHGAGPGVTYTSTGSGAGRGAMGSKDGNRTSPTNNSHTSRFAGTDDPPTPTEQANMNNGSSPGPEDNAVIHIIPVAEAAITVDVNVPSACWGNIPAANLDTTGRLKVPNAKLVGIFAGTVTTWGQVFDAPSGVPACDNFLVRRIVRFDGSGSTFILKTFLNHIANTTPAPFDVANNTTWPNTTGTEDDEPTTCNDPVKTFCKAEGTAVPPAGGGGAVGTMLSNTPGGFGYMDLATARGKSFDFSGSNATDTGASPAGSGATYWMALQSTNAATPGTYVEPTSDANGWKSSAATGGPGPKGANCTSATFNHLPTTGVLPGDPTTGDWSQVDGTAPTGAGYPSCALTWDLAYDDDAAAYGNTTTEEKMARTVKDYLTAVTSVGQASLASYDYTPLSASLDAMAQAGVANIGWNKAADVVVTQPTTVTSTPTTTSTPVTTNPGPPPPPSNKFSVSSSHVSGHKLVVSLQLPGAGKLSVRATGTYKGKSLTVATSSRSVAGGKGSITLNASSKTVADLKKLKSLKVKVTITFTPTGGTAASKSVTLTLKGSAHTTTHKKKSSHKKKKH